MSAPFVLRRLPSLLLAAVALAMVLVGCGGPTYPNCKTDDTCKDKGEYCVDSKCAQCRLDSHCPGAGTNKCVACVKGACGLKPDCCTENVDCGTGKKCDKAANKCVAQCAADGDCPEGQKCTAGACVAPGLGEGAGCKADGDCGSGLKCKDGKCVDASGQCTWAPVFFDFNEYTLSSTAQNGISANAKCMKERNVTSVTVEGHCDERGTDAYNMELGNRRAKAAKTYLQSLLPKVKVKTMSYGKTKPLCSEESEGCWDKNRRAEFRTDKDPK